jgi:hypothetical protein
VYGTREKVKSCGVVWRHTQGIAQCATTFGKM